jgi:hypothetical protein
MSQFKIRSKTFVLIYKSLLNKEELIDFLRTQMKIKTEDDWKYVIKLEEYQTGDTNTVVFCDLTYKPYFLVEKFRFPNSSNGVQPEVLVWNSTHLLKYILTFCGDFDFDCISTNFERTTLIESAKLLKHKINCVNENNVNVDAHTIFESIDNKKSILATNFMSDKQIEKFMRHYENLLKLSESPLKKGVLGLMNLKLNNMLNFKNKHDLTSDQMALISSSRDLIKKVKDLQKDVI